MCCTPSYRNRNESIDRNKTKLRTEAARAKIFYCKRICSRTLAASSRAPVSLTNPPHKTSTAMFTRQATQRQNESKCQLLYRLLWSSRAVFRLTGVSRPRQRPDFGCLSCKARRKSKHQQSQRRRGWWCILGYRFRTYQSYIYYLLRRHFLYRDTGEMPSCDSKALSLCCI